MVRKVSTRSEGKLNIYSSGHAKQPFIQAMPQQLRNPLFLIPHFLVSKLRTLPLFTYTSLNAKTHNTYFVRVVPDFLFPL